MMPGRLRQSTARSPDAAHHSRAYNIPGLEFNEALTWRAGKSIAVADLLARLQALATELRTLEQVQIAAKELTKLAQDLSHSNLLGHKDKGIRACTLCCIVDILNICAPDAPFNPAQLKDIFTVVVNTILPALADPSNAYNAQHVYILDSLVDTKSIVLITDLLNSETLIIPLFTICFDIVAGATQNAGAVELAKSVEFQLRSMLVTIIDEVNLPQEATDIILSQFLRVDPRTSETSSKKKSEKDKKQDTLHLKDYPAAYNMAKSVCTTCPDKMTAHVTQYFGNIIMNASAALEDNTGLKQSNRRQMNLDDSDNDDESLVDLRKAHRLVKELWRACPDVLQSVIPQIESELAADSATLRQLATETLGDIIAGIGISGLPPITTLDPAAYPLPSIEEPEPVPLTTNALLVPASPKPFGSVHATAFQAFLGRKMDKVAHVRSAWISAIGRILLTDAGGIGISADDRTKMLTGFAQMLQDADDKVRTAAIEIISLFDYHRLINVLGSDYGLSLSNTVLSNLADRVSDRKGSVRELAMLTLGRIWGVASRDLCNGIGKITLIVGKIPSRLFNAMYVNDALTHTLIDRVLYEALLPLAFPPTKSKADRQIKRTKGAQSHQLSTSDADHIRVQRMLTLVSSLDVQAKQIFFRIQKRQAEMTKAMSQFLKTCEEYNGGVVDNDNDEKRLNDILTRYIQGFSKQSPDPSRLSSDLWKFVKMHDRRNYQLIRFSMSPEYDYRTMTKAIKELIKRIREGPTSSHTLSETLLPILYRCALIVYNRSHIPAIMNISRTDEGGNAEIAHEILKDVSAVNPEVLKTHIQVLCKELQEHAPTETNAEPSSAPDTLKACSGFARKYPSEVPKDRKFLAALIDYAINSHSYQAAKHAVTIVLTVSDKKELHAKEIMAKALTNCKIEAPQYLARLAAIAQVCLLAPSAAAAEEQAVLRVAVNDCLHKNQLPSKKDDLAAWEAPPSTETKAKELSLSIMVNRCRSLSEKENGEVFDNLAQTVLDVLIRILEENGEIAISKDTASAQKNHLRLAAVRSILKLCSHRQRVEELVTPTMFMTIALVVINPPSPVRQNLVLQLRKYLGRNNLHHRWLTVLFLLAFEPDTHLKDATMSWLKSRVQFYARSQKSISGSKATVQPVMELTFARLLSLLAHHPDYPDQELDNFDGELLDFARYIIFYLQAVATEDNLSLIFHIAQRVKQTQDNISSSDDISRRIYILSDLSQAIIRNYADLMPAHARGVNLLQTYPGRVTMPNTLFTALPSTAKAHEIAAKNFLPEEVAVNLEKLVRSMVKGSKSDKSRRAAPDRKRKSGISIDVDDDDDNMGDKHPMTKKSKKQSLPIRRTPVTKRKSLADPSNSEQPSRKSARVSTTTSVNYAESEVDEDEDEDERQTSHHPSSPLQRVQSARKTRIRETTPEIIDNVQSDDNDDAHIATAHVNGDSENDEPNMSDVDDHDQQTVEQELSPPRARTAAKMKPKNRGAAVVKSSFKTSNVNGQRSSKKSAPSSPMTTTPATRRSTRNAKS